MSVGIGIAHAATRRLADVAMQDTGQSVVVRNFLLAWHNAEMHGSWNPAEINRLDSVIGVDIAQIILTLARDGGFFYPPDALPRETIERLIQLHHDCALDEVGTEKSRLIKPS